MNHAQNDQLELDTQMAIAIAKAQANPFGSNAPTENTGPRIDIQGEGVFPQLNAGIAGTLGAPVDLVNIGLDQVGLGSDYPIGGSQNLSDLGNMAFGQGSFATGAPIGSAETFARGSGEAAGAVIPMLGAAGLISKGSGVAAGVAGDIAAPLASAPLRAFTAEAMAGGGAAVGADMARESDSGVLGEVLSGLAGGLAAGVAPGASVTAIKAAARQLPGVSLAGRGLQAAVAPFTEAGSLEIARRRVQSLSADTVEQASRLEAVPESFSDAERAAVESMTPAQRTGDPRLMSLERTVLNADAALSDEFGARTAETSALLRRAFTEGADGATPRDAVSFIRGRRDYYIGLLQQRVAQAEDLARQKVAALDSGQDSATLSMAMRDELSAALGQARVMEKEIWDLVPLDTPVKTDALQAAWRAIDADTAEALRGRIPQVAARILDRQGGVIGNVNEVHGLYSELGAVIRREADRPDGGQTIRFAKILQDAALEDLGAISPQTEVGRLVDNALAFSLELNQTFRQGTVGRILRSTNIGGSVPPEMTLDISVGRRGIVSAVAVNDIRRAAGSNGNADDAIQNYIKNRFQDYAITDGELNLNRAQTFMRNNSELLDKYPGLQVEMVGAQQSAARAAARGENVAQIAGDVSNPRNSSVAAFTEANRGGEIASIFKAEDPVNAASQVYAQAIRDETGQAIRGYKNGLVDYLLNGSTGGGMMGGPIDEAGQAIISGRRLLANMGEESTQKILQEAFSSDELLRMRRIAAEMARVERSVGSLPNVGDRAITDGPSRIISFVLETVAARKGAQLGAGTSGASLKTSSAAVGRVKAILQGLTEGRATALLRDAIQDPDLFRALMVPPNAATAEANRFANLRLTEWMTGAGAQYIVPTENRNQPE